MRESVTRTSKFTPEQMVMALRQAESGTPIDEANRRLGVSEPTFHRWKKRFGTLGVIEPSCRRVWWR